MLLLGLLPGIISDLQLTVAGPVNRSSMDKLSHCLFKFHVNLVLQLFKNRKYRPIRGSNNNRPTSVISISYMRNGHEFTY